jgi:UDP-N-acetylglucosamine 4,6-dehydratase
VIPLFQRLVAEGATKLPITDPRMTRFWITLGQGVDFVLSSLALMHGGEIFVPKIPSMKMIDLANALAPDLEQEVVGIRPGEKLHEVMVPRDDARATVELDDRFIITPSFMRWAADAHWEGAARGVGEDFRYGSDTNDDWLSPDDLHAMLANETA